MSDETTPDPAMTPALIDHDAIRAANAARAATETRHREAQAALAKAELALRDANVAAHCAARDGGDVAGAEDAVQNAERSLRIAQRVATAAESAFAEAPDTHRQAVGLAHRHAVFDAIERRLAAIRAHEAALAAIATAKADFEAATADLLKCVNVGAPLRGGLEAPRVMPTAEREVHFWRANNVDVSSRTFFAGDVA
jgi:hypothetical protein